MVAGCLIGLLAYVVVFGWLGSWVAEQCGRDTLEGMVLGGLLGPFGVIIEGLLPKFPRDRLRAKKASQHDN